MRRLIIRPGAIGDCILSWPAMQWLCGEYTEVWVPSALVPLIDFADRVCSIASTGLDTLGVGDLPMREDLRQRLLAFDEIVSWYGSARQEFRSALEELGIPCRFLAALPPASSTLYAAEFFCGQVGAPVSSPVISVADKAEVRGTIIIHPFSGSAQKNWPLACYRELAERLTVPVEWLAGPEKELPNAVHFDSLRELAIWMTGAALYIGNDSGITHLAAAIGVSAVALFRSTSPEVWAPRGENVTILQEAGLSVASVLSVVRSKLDQNREHAAVSPG